MPGRYESWFLSARDAGDGDAPRALWIRHTRHRPATARHGTTALWCTLFERTGPQAVKQSQPEFPPGTLADERAFRGEARARGRMATWELALSGEEPPLRHLRPNALYRLPVPRTKLEAPAPDAILSGRVVLDGRMLEIVGWRATCGHNWGAEHAERWVWLHAAGFEDNPEAWLELTLARIKLGRATSPWIANGALSLNGDRLRIGGLGHIPGVRVVASPGRLEAIVPGERADVRVAVHADLDQIAGFRYAGVGADPVRGEREVLHAGMAEVHLNVRRSGRPTMELATAAGGAYELGGAQFTNAVPMQPFPDP